MRIQPGYHVEGIHIYAQQSVCRSFLYTCLPSTCRLSWNIFQYDINQSRNNMRDRRYIFPVGTVAQNTATTTAVASDVNPTTTSAPQYKGLEDYVLLLLWYQSGIKCSERGMEFISFMHTMCMSCLSYPVRGLAIALSTLLTGWRCGISVS